MSKIERSTIQREKILKKAFKLFIEKGYTNTTTREIAAAAQINKGLLHYYYKQKEDIVYDIYNEFLLSLTDFLENEYKDNKIGFSYIAFLNMLYFKIVYTNQKSFTLLSEVLTSNKLAKHKIEKSMKTCLPILTQQDGPITETQLYLALNVSIGSESQLLAGIVEGSVQMDYEELAITIEKLFLTMLQVDHDQIDKIISKALEECNRINIDAFYDYLKKNYAWFQD